MSSSGIWIKDLGEKGIIIGVTDFDVSAFGGDDWEWSITFDRKNADILINNLRKELGEEMTLKQMIISKFSESLYTNDFIKYCDLLNLVYEVKRMTV